MSRSASQGCALCAKFLSMYHLHLSNRVCVDDDDSLRNAVWFDLKNGRLWMNLSFSAPVADDADIALILNRKEVLDYEPKRAIEQSTMMDG